MPFRKQNGKIYRVAEQLKEITREDLVKQRDNLLAVVAILNAEITEIDELGE